MRKLLLLVLILTPFMTLANIRIDLAMLDDFMTLDGDTVHTLKVEIKNESDISKLIYLTNDEEITGYSTKDVDWRNPITFLGELCGDMTMNYKEYIPTAFSLWFKKMDPNDRFTFYFQYTGNVINPQKLLNLIRITDVKNKQRDIDELSWKEDVMVVPLNRE